jgi:hypothetical protein
MARKLVVQWMYDQPANGLNGVWSAPYAPVHLEADQFFTKNNEYNFNPEHIATAHRWCQNATEALLRLHHDVVVSNTFTTLREMVWYRNIAHDLDVEFVVLETTLEIKGDNGHNVPVNTIDKMRRRWEAIPENWYNDGGVFL